MSIQSFFDLTNFAHVSIFEGTEFVWQVLANIHAYLQSQSLGQIKGKVHEGAYLINPEQISIGEGSVVEPGAFIKGPCIIGKECQVRHTAYIRGNVITGNRCVIGHATEVKNSLFLDGAAAAHFAYVGDSILGNDCNLGAGVRCANLRFDGATIKTSWDGESIDTGLRKFGAVIGDKAQIGCNAVLNPGTLLKKGATCYPNEVCRPC